jgi:hypothetical protein
MAKRSMLVGMDVHKESIDVSLAEEDGEVRHDGVITGDVEALAKVVRALRAPTRRLRFVYEAPPPGCNRLLAGQLADESFRLKALLDQDFVDVAAVNLRVLSCPANNHEPLRLVGG